MKLIPEATDRVGEVRRSFVTTMDPIEAFGLANALLGPRGFVLGEGQPGRFQRWNRGEPSASPRTPITELPQFIRLELDHGRIAFTASLQAGVRQAQANALLTGYAGSLESLLAHRDPLEQAAKMADLAESSLNKARNKARRKVAALSVAVFGGLIAAGVFIVMWNPSVKAAIVGDASKQKVKSKNHTPPIVTVRRANQPAQSSVPTPRD